MTQSARQSTSPWANSRMEKFGSVEQTCAALRQVPWTPDLARVVAIVRGTHERLDGSGYPDGITGDRLPLESRIMAVCDTYDALTASDRPYRKAMVPTDALLVLEQEARQGELDADVVALFAGSEVYRSVARTRSPKG